MRDRRYFPYAFFATRLYHRFVHTIKRETADWGILDGDCFTDWQFERYRETYRLWRAIEEFRVKQILRS